MDTYVHYRYIRIDTYVWIHQDIHTYRDTYAWMLTHKYIHRFILIDTSIYIHIIHIGTCISIHTHRYICTDTYI